jgi:AraC-like DNA-binding protein
MLMPAMRMRLCDARDRLREWPLANTPSIATIAQGVSLSPFHFTRQFTAVFGETPHRYRLRMRIDDARRLLALGDLSVEAIGLTVGFGSAQAFSAAFSSATGESPSRYRARVRTLVTVPARLVAVLAPGCLSLMQCFPADVAVFRKSLSRAVAF